MTPEQQKLVEAKLYTRNTQAQASFAAPVGSDWSKAEIHLQMANAAFDLAERNEYGAEMVIEHLQTAVEHMKRLIPNAAGEPQPRKPRA